MQECNLFYAPRNKSQAVCHSGLDKPAPYLIRGNQAPFWIPAPGLQRAGTGFAGMTCIVATYDAMYSLIRALRDNLEPSA